MPLMLSREGRYHVKVDPAVETTSDAHFFCNLTTASSIPPSSSKAIQGLNDDSLSMYVRTRMFTKPKFSLSNAVYKRSSMTAFDNF